MTDRSTRGITVPTIILSAVILLTWSLTCAVLPRLYGAPADAGSFGDMFGSVNALFSGFAFMGVILAIILQSRELQLQREELKLTRTELGRTAQAQEQTATMVKQQVEVLRITAEMNAWSAIAMANPDRSVQRAGRPGGSYTEIEIDRSPFRQECEQKLRALLDRVQGEDAVAPVTATEE